MFIALVKQKKKGKWEPLLDGNSPHDLEDEMPPLKTFETQDDARYFQRVEQHRYMMILPVSGIVEVNMFAKSPGLRTQVSREITKIV